MPKGVMWRSEDIFFAALGGGNPGGPPIERPEEIAISVTENPAQRLTPFLTPDTPAPPQFVSLALGPLMHASGQWSALGTLLGGGKIVLYDRAHVDMEHVLDLVEREAVNSVNLVGDASARPLLETLATHPGRWDTSSLLLLGSGGSILSGASKEALLSALPSVLAIVEGIGSSESPAQAVAVTTRAGSGVPSRSLTFSAKAETIVVDNDLRPVQPGSGVVGRLATRGRVPIGYYKDPERSARTFVEIDGARWSLPGDMATIEADGTVRLLGRGLAVYQHRRREGVSRGGGSRREGTSGGWRRGGRGRARPAVRRTGRGDRRARPRRAAAGPRVDPGALPSTPRGIQGAALVHVVDQVVRTQAGKADYTWAREIANS